MIFSNVKRSVEITLFAPRIISKNIIAKLARDTAAHRVLVCESVKICELLSHSLTIQQDVRLICMLGTENELGIYVFFNVNENLLAKKLLKLGKLFSQAFQYLQYIINQS
jgi:hypothetical protein